MNRSIPGKVIIVEDNAEVREILCDYVNSTDQLTLRAAYSNCEDAIKNLMEDKPDIVLMDIELPGITGIEGTVKIKSIYPKAEVLIITVFENSESVFLALKAGASGYLTKNIQKEELLTSIEECLNGGAPMSMKIAKMVVNSFMRSTDSSLSYREIEVLGNLAKGKSYNSIGEALFISKDTVKYHIKNIYLKLQVSSKEEAIAAAQKQRLI